MTRAETKAVAAVAKDLTRGLAELVELMEAPDDGRDVLQDAKRRDHQHALLAFEHTEVKYRGNDPSRASDFNAPQPKRSEVFAVNGMGHERRLRLEDGSSQVTMVNPLLLVQLENIPSNAVGTCVETGIGKIWFSVQNDPHECV